MVLATEWPTDLRGKPSSATRCVLLSIGTSDSASKSKAFSMPAPAEYKKVESKQVMRTKLASNRIRMILLAILVLCFVCLLISIVELAA